MYYIKCCFDFFLDQNIDNNDISNENFNIMCLFELLNKTKNTEHMKECYDMIDITKEIMYSKKILLPKTYPIIMNYIFYLSILIVNFTIADQIKETFSFLTILLYIIVTFVLIFYHILH